MTDQNAVRCYKGMIWIGALSFIVNIPYCVGTLAAGGPEPGWTYFGRDFVDAMSYAFTWGIIWVFIGWFGLRGQRKKMAQKGTPGVKAYRGCPPNSSTGSPS